ncbi:hypothetical protein HDV05_001729 [Chytridiales sp. JEL 0842]|nr:hypothetical protein HDV05_001729 [Chytridiales sp. JEL 0842]
MTWPVEKYSRLYPAPNVSTSSKAPVSAASQPNAPGGWVYLEGKPMQVVIEGDRVKVLVTSVVNPIVLENVAFEGSGIAVLRKAGVIGVKYTHNNGEVRRFQLKFKYDSDSFQCHDRLMQLIPAGARASSAVVGDSQVMISSQVPSAATSTSYGSRSSTTDPKPIPVTSKVLSCATSFPPISSNGRESPLQSTQSSASSLHRPTKSTATLLKGGSRAMKSTNLDSPVLDSTGSNGDSLSQPSPKTIDYTVTEQASLFDMKRCETVDYHLMSEDDRVQLLRSILRQARFLAVTQDLEKLFAERILNQSFV